MRVLITGSEGFVGRNLIDHLSKGGTANRAYQLTGLDIRHLTPSISMVQGADLAIEDVAIRHLQNRDYDVIVHLASSVSTLGSIERPMETFRNTVRTAVNVLEGARLTNTPVILTSSVKARDGMTPYGAAKRMVELWADEYRKCYGMTIVIDRPGTIYGPGQEGSLESGWIAWFLKARDEARTVTINGNGEQVRDLLHVDDYCRLLEIQLNDPEKYALGIYDVGGGQRNAISVNDMAEHLRLQTEYGPSRYGDAHIYIGENDVPGWEPEVYWAEDELFAP